MAQTTVAINLEAKTKGTESVKSLKTQIREATVEATTLAQKFGALSPEAIAAAKRVAQLKDEMQDFQQRVAALNPDKFEAIANVVTGVAGGIQAMVGALALFGSESEDLQKSLVQIQGAIAFAQGINQVMQLQNSFGAMATMIRTQVVTAFTTLKGALAATGIGALVIAIGAAIQYLSELGSEAEKAAEQSEKALDFIDRVAQRDKQTLELLIAQRKLAGVSEEDLHNTRVRFMEMRIRDLELEQKKDLTNLNVYQKLTEARNELELLQTNFKIQQKEKRDKTSEEELRKAKETEKKNQELAEQRKQNQLEINATMLALDQSTLDAQIKAADAAFATKVAQMHKQGYTEKQIATLRDAELEKVRTEFYEKEKADREKAQQEREQQIKETQEKELADTQKFVNDYFTIQQTALIERNATQQEFNSLELERLNAQLQVARDYGQSTVDIEKDIAAKKKEVYDKDKKAKEDTEKAKRDAEMLTLQSASQILGSLSQLFSENEKTQKAFGLAQIAVDTATALTSAQRNAMSTTPDNVATGGLAGFAKYAAYVGIILSNVARAKALLKTSTGGVGVGAAGTPSAPSFTPITGGTLPDEQQFGGMGRVYVLEGDITKTQTRVRRLRNTSVV